MKKLKIKVSATIFIILTSCVIIIITTLLTGSYIERKNSISDILRNISRTLDTSVEIKEPPNVDIPNNENIKKIYLDFTIYTVILDNNGNYKEIINHTEDDTFDEENIKMIAENIINNHQNDFFVGNLYTTKYAYAYTDNNTLIIMDNTNINDYFIKQLILYISILIICEIIIFIVTSILTKWITTPVKKAFSKQKIFVADASHELKTPLSVIIASTDAYFNDKNDSFKDTESYTWMINNCYKYGFILRYPENKENITGYSYEAWHYRYVGTSLATKIYNEGITFDEYYAYYMEK